MKRLLFLLLPLAICLGASCSRPAAPTKIQADSSHVYHVRGILRSIDFAGGTATIQHEDIPDYMPSMTMPFDVKSMDELRPLGAGDGMQFDLVVDEKHSWITKIEKIAANTVRLSNADAPKPVASGARLKEGDILPEFALTDDCGRSIGKSTFAGHPFFVTFIFTRCPIPNFCPLMSSNFREIRGAISREPALAQDARFLSISFDSGFDTPEVLANYAARYTGEHDCWRFARGTQQQIDKLTSEFSVYVQAEGGFFSHGLSTALIGPDGVIRKIWRGNSWEPAEAIASLRELSAPAGLAAQ